MLLADVAIIIMLDSSWTVGLERRPAVVTAKPQLFYEPGKSSGMGKKIVLPRNSTSSAGCRFRVLADWKKQLL